MPVKRTSKKSAATPALAIATMEQAVRALEEMEAIDAEIQAKMQQTVQLKKDVTAWAVAKKVDVIQLDDHYYRQINRVNKSWDADVLKEITENVKVRGKSLWLKVTKRVPDPAAIEAAVKNGWIDEDEISKAFVEKPQQPFLQKFTGEGI